MTPTNQLLLDAIRAVNILTQEVTSRLQSASTSLSFSIAQALNAAQQSRALVNLGIMAAPVLLSSAGTVDIGAAAASRIVITGTTTIGSLGAANKGITRTVRFDGALTLLHSAGLLLVGGANITTAAGDSAEFESMGSGVWRMTWFSRASGLPLVAPPVPEIPGSTIANVISAMTDAQILTLQKSMLQKASKPLANGDVMAVGASYVADTTGGALTSALPSTAVVGDQIDVQNHLGGWATNNLTITCPSTVRINGLSENLICDSKVGGITLKCTAVDGTTIYWTVRL
jgi:hypothetical protein